MTISSTPPSTYLLIEGFTLPPKYIQLVHVTIFFTVPLLVVGKLGVLVFHTTCSDSYIHLLFFMSQWQEEGRGIVEAILIAQMDVLPSAPGPWIKASANHVTDSPLLPVVQDPQACNCFQQGYKLCLPFVEDKANSPDVHVGSLTLGSDMSDISYEDADESGEECHDVDTDTRQHHNIVVRCAGSAFDRFQPALEEMRALGAGMSAIKISLIPDTPK